MEANVIKNGDLLLYGNLLQELDDLPPATLWKEFRRIGEAYLGDGPEHTRRLHALVDDTIAALIERDQRFGYPPPFCHKGCARCCHELVYCTAEEASGIQNYCQDKGVAIDHAKLRRQLQYIDFDANGDHTGATTWNDQPLEDQSCAFQDPADHACRIWLVRPLVCRVHLAQDTDQYCAPHNGVENPEARGINYIELSYILTVVFTLHRDSIKKTLGGLLLDSGQRLGQPGVHGAPEGRY